MWRHYPWLLGLLLSPILFGAVNPEGQVVVALLFALSLLLLSQELGGDLARPICHPLWLWLAAGCLILPLVPLPLALVKCLSPQRVALAHSFPIELNAAPGWLPLTVSPASTVQRLWELALIISTFWLARHAARQEAFPRRFIVVLAMALLFVAGSDVWLRLSNQQRVLGLWPNSAGHAAGTFANRNHFANWICVAALVAFGWILRQLWPLKSVRTSAPAPAKRFRGSALLVALAILFSLVMAIRTGSRGGLAALAVGVATWMILLMARSQSRKRWWALGIFGFAAFVLLLSSSDYLLARFTQSGTDANFKSSIWRDAFGVVAKFPLLGTGPGTFAIAFNHYKSFDGQHTFLHAENEMVQLLVEQGLLGTLFMACLVFGLIRAAVQFVWHETMAEPELVFGALAGLMAFAAHALVEFVLQIPANAILAAVLLGFVFGSRDRKSQPTVPSLPSSDRVTFTVCWSLALLALATLQGSAWWHERKALAANSASVAVQELQQSLRFWPWESHRQIACAREQVRLLALAPQLDPAAQRAQAEPIRKQLTEAIARDPFHWELRLERAWLDLAFSGDARGAREEAWEVVRLNPLQPQIPFRFARHFATRDPELAMNFVRAAHVSSPHDVNEALALAWSLEHDPASLWKMTPNTPAGLQVLGKFALEQKLLPLAAQAQQQRTNLVAHLGSASRH